MSETVDRTGPHGSTGDGPDRGDGPSASDGTGAPAAGGSQGGGADAIAAAGPGPARAHRRRWILAGAAGVACLLLLRWANVDALRRSDLIVACGRYFAAGTPVVLWTDEGGYDAYRPPAAAGKQRFGAIRRDLPAAIEERVRRSGWRLPDLQQVVHLFVVHFDVAGTSRRCFEVLQGRDLSVHFLLDVDGTIYQTLDLKEHAHHATIANSGSVGVEIAHPGCWPRERHPDMLRWYGRDERGWFMKFPGIEVTGVRTPDFVPRPDRPDVIGGAIHGQQYWQLDFTPEQYRALARLCAALARVFPRLRLEVPRDADGAVRMTQLEPAELHAFDGIVGHFHVQRNKTDPGPAFQWERVLADARALRGRDPGRNGR
jgi:N-acetyl-anhydromuramyl-L-alanine amidase AmpD